MSSTTAHDRRREERRRLARLAAEFADAPAPPPDLSVLLLAAAAVELYGGTTALLDAATIAHVDAGTVLRLSASGGSIAVVGPSQADNIAALLDDYDRLLLLPGTYVPTSPIDIPSSKSLIAPWGLATIVPNWAPVVGDADADSNYAIGLVGVASGTATTLTATCNVGMDVIPVASATGITTGSWLRLYGSNAADNDYAMSDGTAIRVMELVQVASVDGLNVTLKGRLKLHHATGKAVTAMTSVVGNVTIRGIAIRAPGGTIGMGIRAFGAHSITIEDCEVEGLSRAGIDLELCRGVNIRRVYSHGEVNSIVRLVGCIAVRGDTIESNPDGVRYHANGVARALIDLHQRSSYCHFTNLDLQRGCIGVRQWGGQRNSFTHVKVADMDALRAWETDAIFIAGGGFTCGLGLDQGAGFLDHAQFGIGNSYSDWTITDCFSRDTRLGLGDFATNTQYSAFFHDDFYASVSDFRVINSGPTRRGSSSATYRWMAGCNFRDWNGSGTNIKIQGCFDALSTHNVFARGMLQGVDLVSNVGDDVAGTVQQGAAYYANSWTEELRLTSLRIQNFAGFEFAAGPDFYGYATPDYNLRWTEVLMDEFQAQLVVLGKCSDALATRGRIVAPDAAASSSGVNIRWMKIPTANETPGCGVIFMREATTNYILYAPLPQMCHGAITGVAANLGDILVSVAGSEFLGVNNSPTNPNGRLGTCGRETSGVAYTTVMP